MAEMTGMAVSRSKVGRDHAFDNPAELESTSPSLQRRRNKYHPPERNSAELLLDVNRVRITRLKEFSQDTSNYHTDLLSRAFNILLQNLENYAQEVSSIADQKSTLLNFVRRRNKKLERLMEESFELDMALQDLKREVKSHMSSLRTAYGYKSASPLLDITQARMMIPTINRTSLGMAEYISQKRGWLSDIPESNHGFQQAEEEDESINTTAETSQTGKRRHSARFPIRNTSRLPSLPLPLHNLEQTDEGKQSTGHSMKRPSWVEILDKLREFNETPHPDDTIRSSRDSSDGESIVAAPIHDSSPEPILRPDAGIKRDSRSSRTETSSSSFKRSSSVETDTNYSLVYREKPKKPWRPRGDHEQATKTTLLKDPNILMEDKIDMNSPVKSALATSMGHSENDFGIPPNPQSTKHDTEMYTSLEHSAETTAENISRLFHTESDLHENDLLSETLVSLLARPFFAFLVVLGISHMFLSQCRIWSIKRIERWQGKRRLPEGTLCVEWTCHCGHQSHEYMIELYEDAINILADELESSGAVNQASISNFEIGAMKSISQSLTNRGRESKQYFQRLFSPRQPPSPHDVGLQTAADIQLQPLADPPLWLLFCINGSDLAILEHIDLRPVCSDNQLFINLRTAYMRLRSQVTYIRRCLTKLGYIHFVQFQLLPKTYVDGFEMNQLPPLTEDSYEYTRVGLKPPVPIKWMLHLYNNPGHGAELKFCLERFPKKKERLEFSSNEEVIGWGIYFTEKLDHSMVLSLMFVLSSGMGLLFGVLWGVLEKDVSAAFAIASFVTSVGALGVASWASWTVLS